MSIQFLDKVKLHDPTAEKDYTLDWTDWLNGDTLATVDWLIEPITVPPLTSFSPANSPTAATVWVRGGLLGTLYYLTCRVTTPSGRHEDRSIAIRSKNV